MAKNSKPKEKPAVKNQPGTPAHWYACFARRSFWAKAYAVLAVLMLLGTTVYWSYLGSRIQQDNADQLANTYLFESNATFHDASLPAQHSFLIKWPLFLLVKLLGSTDSAFMYMTIAVSVITVAALAYVLFRINRRPTIFGTLCLGLASCLLLVPAQPYAGGILPVNMAMITTRNIEYIVFLAVIFLVAKSPRIRSKRFWLAAVLMIVLSASDKLFLTLSVGAALLCMVGYTIVRKWPLVSLAARWLIHSIIAAVGAAVLLWAFDAVHLTHIIGGSGADPYGITGSVKDVVLGVAYAFLGLLANFGIGPVSDPRVLGQIPGQLYRSAHTLGEVAYIVNAAILGSSVYAILVLAKSSLHTRAQRHVPDTPYIASIMLIASSITAFVVFVGSKHYYPVDARYLTITLFAGFTALATFARGRRWRLSTVGVTAVTLLISIGVGVPLAHQTYATDKAAVTSLARRNDLIAQAVKQHPVQVLVGDYWRVLPIRRASKNTVHTMPMATCTQALQPLSSAAWQQDLHKRSFAYLVSFDQSLTGFPTCSLEDIIRTYGHPNTSTVIAGSLKQPQEMLLFYDGGISQAGKVTEGGDGQPATILPTPLEGLTGTTCTGPTVMNVVAHQDDDLLFMNPDLLHDIHAGHCIRTVYVTSGDAGGDTFYWLSREKGSEAAYASMLGIKDIWVEHVVKLSNHQFITIANPQSNPKISLVFMHLPDGNVHGNGFAATHHESLRRLEAADIPEVHAVDKQSSYTSDELTQSLARLMHAFSPSEIRTQANLVDGTYPDHSDHMAVGRYVQRAYDQYSAEQYEGRVTIPFTFYVGYPIHAMPANVVDSDLSEKRQAFMQYAKHDNGICGPMPVCIKNSAYEYYLSREYTNDY
jgi:LmbE family N-acetylglucosaminyl deacetylase